MAVFVLALGLIMAVSGGYEIYVGSGYIAIEQGWSAFISGTVLLTGGLVTVALGLAIRILTELKAALVDGLRRSPTVATIPPADREPHLDFPQNPDTSLVGRHTSEVLLDSLTPDEVPAPPPRNTDQPRHYPPTLDEMTEISPDSIDHGAPHDTIRPDFRLNDDPVRSTADVPAVAPRSAAGDIEPALEPPPAMDDWLDRSFADLDREFGDSSSPATRDAPTPSARTEPTPASLDEEPLDEPAIDLDRRGSEALPKPEPHRDAPAGGPEERVEPATSASTDIAVIGRYESEGTSYVMYADGSIEAQSDAGLYRFASMAELKSFIEE